MLLADANPGADENSAGADRPGAAAGKLEGRIEGWQVTTALYTSCMQVLLGCVSGRYWLYRWCIPPQPHVCLHMRMQCLCVPRSTVLLAALSRLARTTSIQLQHTCLVKGC